MVTQLFIVRLCSVVLGVLFAFLVSGWHIIHILTEILINAAIIILIDARWRLLGVHSLLI